MKTMEHILMTLFHSLHKCHMQLLLMWQAWPWHLIQVKLAFHLFLFVSFVLSATPQTGGNGQGI